MSMMLSELLPDLDISPDLPVTGLCDDSRKVRPGDVFLAYSGETTDGKRYVADAITQGAVAVLADEKTQHPGVPGYVVPGLRKRIGKLADSYFGMPSAHMIVIAVTGTNGKTSFTHLMAQALGSRNQKAGIVGTMGYGLPGSLIEPGLTTPPALELQRRLSELQQSGCAAVVLEASSHGLAQDRLSGIRIHTAVLTNITHDHLDYHGSFAAYRQAKQRLFEMEGLQTAIVNLDDPSAAEIMGAARDGARCVTYSLHGEADVSVTGLELSGSGIAMTCRLPDGLISVQAKLFGAFNAENILAVVATLVSMGWSHEEICDGVASLTPVAGRMDIIETPGMPIVVVDYAHTPDALEKSLGAIRQHFAGRQLVCVFGCGGDRDRSKRPMMGEIAARLADRIYVTSDNPRSEDPQAILEEICRGMPADADYVLEADRGRAVRQAVETAACEDVVLVAGKGHETYQELATGRIAFSDYDEARAALDVKINGQGS